MTHGQALTWVLIVLAVLLVGGGAWYFGFNSASVKNPNTSGEGINFISPAQNEKWIAGTTHIIKWSAPSSITKVDIFANPITNCTTPPCGSNPSETIAQNVPNTGSYTWTVPSNWVGSWNLNITDQASKQNANVALTVQSKNSTVEVLSPNGGEVWSVGETHDIKWSYSGTEMVGIYLSFGNTEKFIGSARSGVNSYQWTIHANLDGIRLGGNSYKIHIYEVVGSTIPLPGHDDSSNGTFAIR